MDRTNVLGAFSMLKKKLLSNDKPLSSKTNFPVKDSFFGTVNDVFRPLDCSKIDFPISFSPLYKLN